MYLFFGEDVTGGAGIGGEGVWEFTGLRISSFSFLIFTGGVGERLPEFFRFVGVFASGLFGVEVCRGGEVIGLESGLT